MTTIPTCWHCGETDTRLVHYVTTSHETGTLYQCSICGGILGADDEPDDQGGGRRVWTSMTRQRRDRGAVLVEYALILPVAIMLGVSGLFYGLAMVSDLRITHAVSQAVQLEEGDAGALVMMAGGSLECYWEGTGPGGCFDDGLDGLERRQAVAVGETYHPPLFDSVTPRAEAVAVVPAEP